jgi:hypothetical protein
MSIPNTKSIKTSKVSPKTKKARQARMTDYYKSNKKVPSFDEIYENRDIFPEVKTLWGTSGDKWRYFVEYFAKFKDSEDPNKIQLFYADGYGSEYLEDQYDYENMLDIHKPLTKKYLDKLYSSHLRWLKKQPYDYEGYYENSYTRFDKLRRLPSTFVKYVNAKLHAKNFIANNKLPKVMADYADSFVMKNPSYEKLMTTNKTRKLLK